MKNTDNQTIELSPNQQNPYLARPEDFPVQSGPPKMTRPFHRQNGDNVGEFNRMLNDPRTGLNRSKPTGKGVPLPTEPDDAGPPHTKVGRHAG